MDEISVLIESVSVEGDMDATFSKALGVKYTPFKIEILSDHARFIEFGTNGVGKSPAAIKSRPGQRYKTGIKSDAYENIREWAYARYPLPLLSGNKTGSIDDLAYVIYKKIMNEGIPPQPFIRPALFAAQEKIKNGSYKDMTIEDIAKDIASEMKRMLDENLTSYGEENLANSIWVGPMTTDEALRNLDSKPIVNGVEIPDYIWNDPEMDLNGNVERARARKRRVMR